MGGYTMHSSLAERVRAAVACFKAAEATAGKPYVLLEAADLHEPGTGKTVRLKRIAVRRIYAGEHKSLEGKFTVVVGLDLGEPTPVPVAIPVHHLAFEVTVRGTPWGGADVPFEGTLDLKPVSIPE